MHNCWFIHTWSTFTIYIIWSTLRTYIVYLILPTKLAIWKLTLVIEIRKLIVTPVCSIASNVFLFFVFYLHFAILTSLFYRYCRFSKIWYFIVFGHYGLPSYFILHSSSYHTFCLFYWHFETINLLIYGFNIRIYGMWILFSLIKFLLNRWKSLEFAT